MTTLNRNLENRMAEMPGVLSFECDSFAFCYFLQTTQFNGLNFSVSTHINHEKEVIHNFCEPGLILPVQAGRVFSTLNVEKLHVIAMFYTQPILLPFYV